MLRGWGWGWVFEHLDSPSKYGSALIYELFVGVYTIGFGVQLLWGGGGGEKHNNPITKKKKKTTSELIVNCLSALKNVEELSKACILF